MFSELRLYVSQLRVYITLTLLYDVLTFFESRNYEKKVRIVR